MNLVIDLISKFYKTFFLTRNEKKLKKQFIKEKKDNSPELKILVQNVEDLYYYCLFGTFIKSLSKTRNIHVDQFVQRNLTLGSTSKITSFLKSIFLNNRLRDNKWIRFYSSFCDGIAYRHEGSTGIAFDIIALIKAYDIFKNIKSNEELISLEIDNIYVGDLIYDSYLRFKPSSAIDITSAVTEVNATSGAAPTTLADGANGQIKTIINVSTGGSNAVNIVPSNLRGGTTITLNAPGETVTCMFKNSNWNILAGNGYSVS